MPMTDETIETLSKSRKYAGPRNAFKAALDAVGGRAALARRIGVSRQAIKKWIVVPLARVVDVERATGVHRSLLCPEHYPSESSNGVRDGAEERRVAMDRKAPAPPRASARKRTDAKRHKRGV